MSQKSEGTSLTRQQMMFIGAIVAVAVVAAVVFIVLSLNDTGGRDEALEDIPVVADIEEYEPVVADDGTPQVVQWRMSDGGFVIGHPDAPITIVEFADFLCPACQAYKDELGRFIRDFVLTGQANFEYRMIPTQNLSPFVAAVAECAAEEYEGGFWPVHEELFAIANSRSIDDDIGRDIADEFDLDYAELLECTQQADQLENDGRLAGRSGAQSTPTIRVRYGDGDPQVISQSFASGGVPYEILAQLVLAVSIQ